MKNPNNCDTCDYRRMHEAEPEGHCYMFYQEPTEVCMQHTGRSTAEVLRMAAQYLGIK